MQSHLHNLSKDYQPSIADSNVRSVVSFTSLEGLLAKFKTYQPKGNVIPLQQLHKSPHLKLKKYRQAAFYGEIINNQRHGYGVMLYNNQRFYQGEWSCDHKNGMGYEGFPNQCVYQGCYVNGKPEGVGKYQWPNGEFYQGEWVNGLKHGPGMWKGAKGDSYVGEWKFGKADGYGVHVWINGDRYQGDFRQSLKHGEGTEKFQNGDLHKGSYYRGKPHGFGQYFWASGAFYKGEFKSGQRDGNGIWKKSSGSSDKFEGEYREDKKNGYGIFTWTNGNIYKGNYKDDLREGYGQMYWLDGSYYIGQWSAGQQNGEGMIYTPQIGIKKGRFKGNVLEEVYPRQQFQAAPPVAVKVHKKRRKFTETAKTKVESKSPHSSTRNQRSLEVKKVFRSQVYAKQIDYKKMPSNTLIPQSRLDELQKYSMRYRQTKSKSVTPGPQSKKAYIPHSAVWMHRVNQRGMQALRGRGAHSVYQANSSLAREGLIKEFKLVSPTNIV